VAAERGVLIALEGDCKTPLGAYGERVVGADGQPALHLRAFVSEPDGSKLRRREETIAWPASDEAAEAFGKALGARLRAG